MLPTARVRRARAVVVFIPNGFGLAAVSIPALGPAPWPVTFRCARRRGEQDTPHGGESLKALLRFQVVQVHPGVEQVL